MDCAPDRFKVDAELMAEYIRQKFKDGIYSIDENVHLTGNIFARVDKRCDPPRYYNLTSQQFANIYDDTSTLPKDYSVQIDIYSYINWLENKILIRNHKKKI